ncbi:MAG: hypothetical protein U0942_06665 [Parvibaculum sp.]|uniref:hypothetical protein n=1 Tax=Parvibaculum sp. TaxID=2024848 RepID=UPI002ABBB78C|nr:hypothetical protein [Parvibaculum sp.]MDZ4381007.1 hypothetical protein [Parvibaculum sp.]
MRSSFVALLIAGALAGCAGGGGDPVATSRSSSPSAAALGGTQLGVSGDGGASEELLGADLLTPLIGGSGLLGGTLSGGSDGVLAGNLPAESPIPADALSPLTDALAQVESQVPPLGVSGEGGLGEDLLGYDLTGALIGTEGGLMPNLLTGGGEAQLGAIVPEGSAPLAPVGDLARDIVEGAQSNANDGTVNALAPVLSPILLAALGASEGGDGSPVPVALPSLPIEELSPVLLPLVSTGTEILGTPILPNGTTATDVVFPVVLGAVGGIADATLPLETIADTAVTILP